MYSLLEKTLGFLEAGGLWILPFEKTLEMPESVGIKIATFPQNNSNKEISDRVTISWLFTYSDEIASVIQNYKYNKEFSLIPAISRAISREYPEYGYRLYHDYGSKPEVLAYLPSGKLRTFRRGFEHGAFVASRLSKELGLRYLSGALKSCRGRKSQTGLTKAERRANVCHGFSACKELVFGKSVLLYDDTVTTGASLIEASKELLSAGALQVHCLCLAAHPEFQKRNKKCEF